MAPALTDRQIESGFCGCGRKMSSYRAPLSMALAFSCCNVFCDIPEHLAVEMNRSARARDEVYAMLRARHRLWQKLEWGKLCRRITGGVSTNLVSGHYSTADDEIAAFNRSWCYPSMVRVSLAIHCEVCRKVVDRTWTLRVPALNLRKEVCFACVEQLRREEAELAGLMQFYRKEKPRGS